MEDLICYSKFQWNTLYAREEAEQPLKEVMCGLVLLGYLLSKVEWLGVRAPELTRRGSTPSSVPTSCATWANYTNFVRKMPWRGKWKPTPVFLPGESHGQRSLRGYCPWGCKESDIAEWLTLTYFACLCVDAKLVQSCLTLCNLMDCRPPGSSVPGLLRASIQSGLHALLQGIFLTQGLNLHLLHWQVLYH